MRVYGIDASVRYIAITKLDTENKEIKSFLFVEDEHFKRQGLVTYAPFQDIFKTILRQVIDNHSGIAYIEKPFFQVKGYAQDMFITQGVIAGMMITKNIQVIFLNPSRWKKRVIGTGKATKSDVKHVVKNKLKHLAFKGFKITLPQGLKEKQKEHIYDSIAIALYHNIEKEV